MTALLARAIFAVTIALPVTLPASAYADNPAFENERDFAAHVETFQLRALTIEGAKAKLKTEGFACHPAKTSIYCTRKTSGIVCDQKQIVMLPAVAENAPPQVSTHLAWICL